MSEIIKLVGNEHCAVDPDLENMAQHIVELVRTRKVVSISCVMERPDGDIQTVVQNPKDALRVIGGIRQLENRICRDFINITSV